MSSSKLTEFVEIVVISSDSIHNRYKSLMMFIKLHKNKEEKSDGYTTIFFFFFFGKFQLVLELPSHSFSSCFSKGKKKKADLSKNKVFPWKDSYQF